MYIYVGIEVVRKYDMTKVLKRLPFLWSLAIASVLSTTVQVFAYTGTSGLKSIWSGTSGWATLWNGVAGTITLDAGPEISSTTSTTLLTIPVIYGVCVMVALLTGIVFAITHSIKAVLVTIIAGLLGLIGIIMLESVVMRFFGG